MVLVRKVRGRWVSSPGTYKSLPSEFSGGVPTAAVAFREWPDPDVASAVCECLQQPDSTSASSASEMLLEAFVNIECLMRRLW